MKRYYEGPIDRSVDIEIICESIGFERVVFMILTVYKMKEMNNRFTSRSSYLFVCKSASSYRSSMCEVLINFMKKEIKNLLSKKSKPDCTYLIRLFAETIDAMVEQKGISRGQSLYKNVRYMYSVTNSTIFDCKNRTYMNCKNIAEKYRKSKQ